MLTILVVDDEFGIGEVLEAILTDEGYRVVTAINGHHALERLAGNRIDLVLSDLMMPVMDGAVLFKALQADARYAGIPFVLMCSLPEANIADRIRDIPPSCTNRSGSTTFSRRSKRSWAVPRLRRNRR